MKNSRLQFLYFLLILALFIVVFSTNFNQLVNTYNPSACFSGVNKTQQRIDSFRQKYPFLLECQNPYLSWTRENVRLTSALAHNYSQEAPKEYRNLRITRAVIIYFPIESLKHFEHEFKWLYRSWIHMLEYEPALWRTDLIVFLEKDEHVINSEGFFFTDLNCTFDNTRQSATDKPLCKLISHTPIRKRKYGPQKTVDTQDYLNLINKIDIFTEEQSQLEDYYVLIKNSLINYKYADSILMAFDGYPYFKKAGYDFLIRSDMDVFLTPLFATWLPYYCNDFYVGGGGYSNTFNSKRFKRIASNLGLAYNSSNNLGSTWYSTPNQFRLVSYLTLLGMAYLNNEEFAQPEREQKLGTILWPEWHYGVLLLYGQHLMVNHLIRSGEINLVKLENHLDFPSGNNQSVFNMIHIHVFHGDNLFSKQAFRMGKYDKMIKDIANLEASNKVAMFALKMALEGKFIKHELLLDLFMRSISNKN